MVGCCAPLCRNRSETSVFTFHRFPRDPERRSIWIKNCNFSQYSISVKESSKLCGVHFDISQFETHRADGKFKLKQTAIPTIFFGPSEVAQETPQDPLKTDKDEYRDFPEYVVCECSKPKQIVPDVEELSEERSESVLNMWKTFVCRGELFLIKFSKCDNEYEILLNDFKNIWLQKMSEDVLLEQFLLNNPMFDIKQTEAVTQVENVIDHINDKTTVTTEVERSFDTIHLQLTSKASEFVIKFKFNFSKTSTEMFLQEVTVPFVQTIKYLEDQRSILSNLLQKKDRELEEYKLEKGEISRTDLVTEKFEEKSLNVDTNKLVLNVFSKSPNFWTSFVEQHGNVELKMETAQDTRKDPWNQVKKRKKNYSAKTAKKRGVGITYDEENS